MRVSVTELDQLIWFRKLESMTTEDLIARLRREEPPNRAMAMGTAWHAVLEEPPEDEILMVSRDGFTFIVETEASITLPQVREIRAEKTYIVDGLPVTLTGGCDGISGNVVYDHKLTDRPNPEKYFDSFQWRAYLDIFGADTFRYVLWHALDKKDTVIIRDVSEFPIYRYPTMRDDLMVGLHDFVHFARQYLPERFETEEAA